MGQVSPLEGRQRIVLKQRARLLLSKPIADYVVRRLQTKRPGPRIVCIAGDEMDEALADPTQRVLLRARSETSGQRASGHLSEAALAHPLFQALRLRAQDSVPLRVGDHRPHAGELNSVQRLVHRRRDRKLVELQQQIIALIDAILPGILAQRPKIFRVEMKIAAGGNFQSLADFGLQLGPKLAYVRKIEKVFVAGMRRRDDVCNSIGNRGFRHRHRFFHGSRAIVESRQNVTVQINHSNDPPLAPPSTERLQRAEHEKNSSKNPAHQPRLDPFGHFSSGDTSQKYAGDQQQSSLPRYKSFSRIRHQRQHSGGWYERDQGCSLRAMLAERKQQPQERDQKHAAANAKHPRCNSTHPRDREDSRAAAYRVRHQISPARWRPRLNHPATFSRATAPPASGNIQMLLLSAAMAWEARSNSLDRLRKAFPAHRESRRANPPGLASNIRARRRVRSAATK